MPYISKKQFHKINLLSQGQKTALCSNHYLSKDDLQKVGLENLQKSSIFFKFKEQPNPNGAKTFPLMLFIKGSAKKYELEMQQDLLAIGNLIQELDLNIIAGIEFQKPKTRDDALVVYFKGFPSYILQQQEDVTSELKLQHIIKIAKAILEIEHQLSYCEMRFNFKFKLDQKKPLSSTIHAVPSQYFFIDSEEFNTHYMDSIIKILEFNPTLKLINNYINDVKNEFGFNFLSSISKEDKINAANALYDMVINSAVKDTPFESHEHALIEQFPILRYSSMRNLLNCWKEQIESQKDLKDLTITSP